MKSMDEWLRSDETGEPFSHCVRCHLPLLEIDEPWLVNKEFRGAECVLEYAICVPCRNDLTGQLSEESKESVRGFLRSEIDWETRITEFMMMADPVDRFASCVICETGQEACEVFGISALHDSGGELTLGPLPLMVCGGCIGKITDRLSPESRAVWRKFLNDYFAGPSDETIPGTGFSGLF